MFVLNRWYVAAFESELTAAPARANLFDEDVVLYRGASGAPVALEDRCCHRNLPLSHGRIEGDRIACCYHGLVYDASGRCVKVPGQDVIPPDARVRSFPIRVKDGLAWLWPGDPSIADEASIPDYPIHRDSRRAHKGSHYRVACNPELINDNLIDLSHVGYVHGKTIGGTPEAHSAAELQTERREDGVSDFVPGVIRVYIGANDAGEGVDQEGRMDRLGIRIFNGITPESATQTHCFWTAAHNFDVGDDSVTTAFHGEIAATFEEDRQVVEAQQRRFERYPDRKTVQIRSDAGGAQARRAISRLLESEREEAAPVPL